jgi:glyoxylase-like metal-dependent hydrolase (beta-lactamase superfamily II)
MPSIAIAPVDSDLTIEHSHVTVLMGTKNGKYPSGNSMLVQGSDSALLIDPSIEVFHRGGAPASIDHVLVSHAHEDHIAGISTMASAHVHAHSEDVNALTNIEHFLDVYGMPEPSRTAWRQQVIEDFHYTPRSDATEFQDGSVFDLGGVHVRVVHLPGHTRGHCGFFVEPDGIFFVADIDLSTFGPYYGDHWSDLEDFERAIDRCRSIEAKHYVTFHQKGIVSGHSEFVSQLDAFASVIATREQRLLAFLSEPRTIAEIVSHRIVYRPETTGLLWIDHVEEVSASMHLKRLERDGGITQVEPQRWRRA